MSMGLTRQQAAAMRFIRTFSVEHGYAPSLMEIGDAVGLKRTSRSRVHEIVGSLVERGMLRKIPNRARAIEVIAPDTFGAELHLRKLLSDLDMLHVLTDGTASVVRARQYIASLSA